MILEGPGVAAPWERRAIHWLGIWQGLAWDSRFRELYVCCLNGGCGSSSGLWLPPAWPGRVVRRPFSLGGRRSDCGCVRWAGRHGRAGGRAAPAACHKEKEGPRAAGQRGHTHGSEHWCWGTGLCSGQAVSSLPAAAGGRFCQIWIRIELLSNNFPVEEEK